MELSSTPPIPNQGGETSEARPRAEPPGLHHRLCRPTSTPPAIRGTVPGGTLPAATNRRKHQVDGECRPEDHCPHDAPPPMDQNLSPNRRRDRAPQCHARRADRVNPSLQGPAASQKQAADVRRDEGLPRASATGPTKPRRLLADLESLDDVEVPLRFDPLEIVEQATAATDHLQQTTPAGEVF